MEEVQYRELLMQKLGKPGSLIGDGGVTWGLARAGSYLFHQGLREDSGVTRTQKPGLAGRAGPWQEMLSEEMQPQNTPKMEGGGKDKEASWLLLPFHFPPSIRAPTGRNPGPKPAAREAGKCCAQCRAQQGRGMEGVRWQSGIEGPSAPVPHELPVRLRPRPACTRVSMQKAKAAQRRPSPPLTPDLSFKD